MINKGVRRQQITFKIHLTNEIRNCTGTNVHPETRLLNLRQVAKISSSYTTRKRQGRRHT